MIQELLKIASEDKECEEKLAYVYQAMETPGEFTEELNDDIAYLLEEVQEKLEKTGVLLDTVALPMTGGLSVPLSAAYGYYKGKEVGRSGEKLDNASLPGLALSPINYGAYRIAKGIGHQSGTVDKKFLDIGTEKQAIDFSSIGKSLGGLAGKAKPYAGALGLGAAGVVGSNLVNDMYSLARTAVTRNRNYEKMLGADPELKEYPAEKVKAYFNTLHEKGGPEMSGDPLIASAFVKQQLELPPQFLLEQVHKLVGTRANIDKSKGSGSFDFSRLMRNQKPETQSSLPNGPSNNQDPYLY